MNGGTEVPPDVRTYVGRNFSCGNKTANFE